MKRFIALAIIAIYGLAVGVTSERPKKVNAQSTPIATVSTRTPIQDVAGDWWAGYTREQKFLVALGFQLGAYAAGDFLDQATDGGTDFKAYLVPDTSTSQIVNGTDMLYDGVPMSAPLYIVLMNAYNPPLIELTKEMKGVK